MNEGRIGNEVSVKNKILDIIRLETNLTHLCPPCQNLRSERRQSLGQQMLENLFPNKFNDWHDRDYDPQLNGVLKYDTHEYRIS